MTDLTPKQLDALDRKYKPNYPAVYIDTKTARVLIAMARGKQEAERERDVALEVLKAIAELRPGVGALEFVQRTASVALAQPRDAGGAE